MRAQWYPDFPAIKGKWKLLQEVAIACSRNWRKITCVQCSTQFYHSEGKMTFWLIRISGSLLEIEGSTTFRVFLGKRQFWKLKMRKKYSTSIMLVHHAIKYTILILLYISFFFGNTIFLKENSTWILINFCQGKLTISNKSKVKHNTYPFTQFSMLQRGYLQWNFALQEIF